MQYKKAKSCVLILKLTILCQKLNKNVLNPKYLDDAAGLKVQTINKTCSTQISALNGIFTFSKHKNDKEI